MKTRKAAVAALISTYKDNYNSEPIQADTQKARKAIALEMLKGGMQVTAMGLNVMIGGNDARRWMTEVRFELIPCGIVESSIGWNGSIRIITSSVDRRPPTMNKPHYRKPQAVRELERMALDHFRRDHPNFPEYAIPPQSYRDNTANGLTKCIVDYIRHNGGQAERVATIGMPEQRGGRIVWRKSNTTKGSVDISATIAGRSVKIEVKIGLDHQSEAQRRYQASIERAGGLYFVAKDFTTFVEWYSEKFNRDCYGKS